MKDNNIKDLDIKKLLEENDVKTLVDLDVLIGKMKKNFIESALEADLMNILVMQSMIKIQERFQIIIEKEKLKKPFQLQMAK